MPDSPIVALDVSVLLRLAGLDVPDVRILRELGTDFARSWARVSRDRGQPFRGCGQAGGFMESFLIGLVKRFRDAGPASQAFS